VAPVLDDELAAALGYARFTRVRVKGAYGPFIDYGLVYDYRRTGDVTVRMECERFKNEDVSGRS
jgi:hypothetical protein